MGITTNIKKADAYVKWLGKGVLSVFIARDGVEITAWSGEDVNRKVAAMGGTVRTETSGSVRYKRGNVGISIYTCNDNIEM